MNGLTIARVRMRSFCLVLLFTLCQIVGTMCTVPDLLLADDAARLVEEMGHMACPMDNTIMCPPSLTASPERQIKNSAIADVAFDLISQHAVRTPVDFSDSVMSSVSSADSIVPISIASSSVLRI